MLLKNHHWIALNIQQTIRIKWRIRFSDKLTGLKTAYFLVLVLKSWNTPMQFNRKSKYIYKVKDNLYVISAKSDGRIIIFTYYAYKQQEKTEK